jgi:hypothetical protein
MKFVLPLLVGLSACLKTVPEKVPSAQELFSKMEKRLATARTVRFVMKANFASEVPERLEATLLLGERNKFSLILHSERGGKEESTLLKSDGARMAGLTNGNKDGEPKSAPPEMNAAIRLGLARAGAGLFPFYSKLTDVEKINRSLGLANFRFGVREKVDAIEAEVVEYKLTIGILGALHMKVWIDPSTTLPLRRAWSMLREGEPVKFEVEEKCIVDEAIDEASFTLP